MKLVIDSGDYEVASNMCPAGLDMPIPGFNTTTLEWPEHEHYLVEVLKERFNRSQIHYEEIP